MTEAHKKQNIENQRQKDRDRDRGRHRQAGSSGEYQTQPTRQRAGGPLRLSDPHLG